MKKANWISLCGVAAAIVVPVAVLLATPYYTRAQLRSEMTEQVASLSLKAGPGSLGALEAEGIELDAIFRGTALNQVRERLGELRKSKLDATQKWITGKIVLHTVQDDATHRVCVRERYALGKGAKPGQRIYEHECEYLCTRVGEQWRIDGVSDKKGTLRWIE